MYSIGFVILTWNSEKHIAKCLESLFQLDSSEFAVTITVIDNGSSDNTLKEIERALQTIENRISCHVIELKKNHGTTYSRNLGIDYLRKQKTKPSYICILDSDTIVNQFAIRNLAYTLEKDNTCGIIGPKMHDSNMVYQRSGRQIPTLTEKLLKIMPIKKLQARGVSKEAIISSQGTGTIKVGYLMSACWMMRTELFEQIGLLDENIFYAPEDAEFCIRSWKYGLSVQYCYDADIIHEWQRLSRKKLLSKHNYEHIKGLIYMFWKHKYMFSTKKIMTIEHTSEGEK